MYTTKTTFVISAAHRLELSYSSKCENLHGHNWRVTVVCKARTLNADGMVTDFTRVKAAIRDRLDHRDLNRELPFNPTAENLARWIVGMVPNAVSAEVEESEGNVAIYERDYEEKEEA